MPQMDDSSKTDNREYKRKVAVALIFSAVVLFASIWLTGVFENTEIGEELFKDLCDSFFTVGGFYTIAGLLAFAAKNGAYNFFSYNGRTLVSFFVPSPNEKKRAPYHEYLVTKEEERKSWRLGYILIIGGAYCAVGMVFLAFYYYFPYQ